MSPLQQIKQRKVVQWALAYLAGAWLVLQLVGLLADAYAWPDSVLRVLPVVLVVGLLIVLVVAWYHGEKGAQRVSVPELIMIAGILVLAGAAIAFVRKDKPDAADDVAAAETEAAEQGSIAVLPFADMSPGKDQTYFSDGLTEELLNVLTRIPELRVAARTSSFSFRDSKASIDSIARALRVEYILEGSVRTAADRVRITAQLIKAATGYHIWSNTYDRDLKDVFAVQEEISKAIVDTLRLKIGGGSATAFALARSGTENTKAHELTLRGMFALNQRTTANLLSAKTLFEEAIALDPKYARAHAALGTTHWYIAYRRAGPVAENYKRAQQYARRALELDSTTAEAHVVLGRVADVYEWKFKEAEAQFARALALNPGLADAYTNRAWLLMRLGHKDASLAAARRSVELDPVAINSHNTLGSMLSYAGQYEASDEAYRTALSLNPENSIVLSNTALNSAALQRFDEGIAKAQLARRLEPDDHFAIATLAYVYARAGRRAEAAKTFAELRRMDEVPHYLVAMIYVGLGEYEQAFRELDRAVEQHDDFVGDLGVDDVFKPLRNDPRFGRLLERLGLPKV